MQTFCTPGKESRQSSMLFKSYSLGFPISLSVNPLEASHKDTKYFTKEQKQAIMDLLLSDAEYMSSAKSYFGAELKD